MSLRIEVKMVSDVLLSDGWHSVNEGTFELDAYEFIEGTTMVHEGGQGGISSGGFSFKESADSISGPLSSVIAVRHR